MFYCPNCGYRITRKLDRFIYLTPWSDSIKNLKPQQQLSFLQNLFEANLCWMKNLPIYRVLNQKLNTNTHCNYNLQGGVKKTKQLTSLDQAWYDLHFDKAYEKNREKLQQGFGKNAAYSMLDQVSEHKPCCVDAYYQWLFDKCGMTERDVFNVENDLARITTTTYKSPTLSLALDMYEEYKSTLLN